MCCHILPLKDFSKNRKNSLKIARKSAEQQKTAKKITRATPKSPQNHPRDSKPRKIQEDTRRNTPNFVLAIRKSSLKQNSLKMPARLKIRNIKPTLQEIFSLLFRENTRKRGFWAKKQRIFYIFTQKIALKRIKKPPDHSQAAFLPHSRIETKLHIDRANSK